MNQKSKGTTVEQIAENKTDTKAKVSKTCFVIMPIADMDGYELGHFLRVYEHLIVPACINAGYEPHRADAVAASNYIIIDILRKIVESDMVVCDLSGRNPNVLYELGVRQAFNLPTVLIKDTKTSRIFDIQGLRCADYSHTLRIDEVQKDQETIRKAMVETADNPSDVNSMIQLLGVSPAPLPNRVELSSDTSVILESLKDISFRLANIESLKIDSSTTSSRGISLSSLSSFTPITLDHQRFIINGEGVVTGETLYIDGKILGDLVEVNEKGVLVTKLDGKRRMITRNDPIYSKITSLPF